MEKSANTPTTKSGDRIAKVLARAGVASRREAERMIEAGRVSVNGKVIDSPALNVTEKDKIEVDGKPLAEPEHARMWLYYKPLGLVTTESDEKGRETVFDALPEELGRVLSVGRLDINSEGLLLLTNDGGIKRKLELPSTGWLRRYRVRVNGRPDETTLEPLRKGISVDGETFQPMIVSLDRQQGANAWLTVSIREGKNREIRRAMAAIGLTVNRLLRVSYGPFRLGELKPGEVEEVKQRVLRDQLGLAQDEGKPSKPMPVRKRKEPAAKGKAAGFKGAAKSGASGARSAKKPRKTTNARPPHKRNKS
ncbi:pseudouridine synthase [Halocynthiibacter sp. C4]|uniref:pseudouridine synthase n=1 Tax=Halocynthiibacter sp. C4 TaxID=2992758 RepID=UPI00237AF9E7|nr:pseudouridine synthase [Halocynthiibacter sp. C4]MDE0588747.1 pseudouridine synthase [Halocynthiibacter sp. C4]